MSCVSVLASISLQYTHWNFTDLAKSCALMIQNFVLIFATVVATPGVRFDGSVELSEKISSGLRGAWQGVWFHRKLRLRLLDHQLLLFHFRL